MVVPFAKRPSLTAEVPFEIYNPTDQPATVYLEVRQLLTRGEEQEEPLWDIWIKHPEPQLFPPGESRTAVVFFDPKRANIGPGAMARFVLTAFVGDQMIGGAQFEITVR